MTSDQDSLVQQLLRCGGLDALEHVRPGGRIRTIFGKEQAAALDHPKNNTATMAVQAPATLRGRRVIFVLGNLELGGAERQALVLAKHLKEFEQAAVQVWGFNKSGPVAEVCEQLGIRWRVVPYPVHANSVARSKSLLQVAWQLRRARPEILLPYTSVPNTVCGLVWKWTGARCCVWNQRDEGIVSLAQRWESWAVKRTPLFISNSTAGARFLTKQLNVCAANVRVVPNGVEETRPQLDRRAWRKKLGIDETAFVACMVANLHTNKDHQTLLRAWSTVMFYMEKKKRQAVLVLAGRHDGAYEALVAVTGEVGIARDVRFAGQVSDVAGLLSAVDIGVFCSKSEGCPNGVLECMAAGLAVAGSDIAGIREVVGPTGASLLTPAGDQEELSRVILRLADDPELRARIGIENHRRIRERFTARRMCEETLSVLLALLQKCLAQ